MWLHSYAVTLVILTPLTAVPCVRCVGAVTDEATPRVYTPAMGTLVHGTGRDHLLTAFFRTDDVLLLQKLKPFTC